jgi:hypothetical protein
MKSHRLEIKDKTRPLHGTGSCDILLIPWRPHRAGGKPRALSPEAFSFGLICKIITLTAL